MILINLNNVARYYGTRSFSRTWLADRGRRAHRPRRAERRGQIEPARLLAGVDAADGGQVAARRGLQVAILPQEVPAPEG